MKLIVACLLVPLAVAQYGCTNCQTGYNTNSQYGNNVQRDPTSSGSEPGYLPDYQGDKYTDPQRIKDTQALNKPFFDSIGGAPSPPPLTPAQQGMTGPQYTNTGNQGQQGYINQNQPNNIQYQTQGQVQNQQYMPQYQPQQNNMQYQPVNTMYTAQQQQQIPQQYQNNQATQMPGSQPMYQPTNGCNPCPQGAYQNQQQQYGRTPNYVQSMGYNANAYSPSSTTSYSGSSLNSNQRFYNPSNSPTANYNQFTNTNLGYPYSGSSGVQRDQSSSLSGTYTGNNNIPLYDTTIGTRNAYGQTVNYANAPFPASNYYASSTPSSTSYGYSSTYSPTSTYSPNGNSYGYSSTSNYGNNGYSSSTYSPNGYGSASTYSPSYSNSYNQNMGYTSGSNINTQYYSPSASSYSTGYNTNNMNNNAYGRAYDSSRSYSNSASSSCCSTQSTSCCYQTGTSGSQTGSTSIYYDPSLSANSYNRQYYGKK